MEKYIFRRQIVENNRTPLLAPLSNLTCSVMRTLHIMLRGHSRNSKQTSSSPSTRHLLLIDEKHPVHCFFSFRRSRKKNGSGNTRDELIKKRQAKEFHCEHAIYKLNYLQLFRLFLPHFSLFDRPPVAVPHIEFFESWIETRIPMKIPLDFFFYSEST